MSMFFPFIVYRNGSLEEEIGVRRITFPENNRSSGKSGSNFTGDVRTRIVIVYFKHTSWCIHVLWSLPTSMVHVRVTNLYITLT